ncbi:MAG: YeiH family protein [Ectobacillus sp.]
MQTEKIKTKAEPISYVKLKRFSVSNGHVQGIALTAVIAFLAVQVAKLPVFSIMGAMILAILIGMIWRIVMGFEKQAAKGIAFSSKILLRAGIILMGVRLQLMQIYEAGLGMIMIDIVVVASTIIVMMSIGRLLKLNRHVATLVSVGTAVCGAAAIMAVAPLIKSKPEQNALSVAYIALFGTIGSLLYIFSYQFLSIDPYVYGLLTGATLHELAHVIAASAPGGDAASETAMMVKLGRVALLVPVAMCLGYLFSKASPQQNRTEKRSFRDLPIPWFIFGFLFMSVLNTFHVIPQTMIGPLIYISTFFMAMAMAGLGLNTDFCEFKRAGWRLSVLSLLGCLFIAALGIVLVLVAG